jgi:hypothetical protein
MVLPSNIDIFLGEKSLPFFHGKSKNQAFKDFSGLNFLKYGINKF